MKSGVNWKLFGILLVTCVITSLLVIPYTLELTSSEIQITPVILLLSAAQNLVLFAIAVFFGLLLSRSAGLGLPVLEGMLAGENRIQELRSLLAPSIGLGVAAGILIIVLSIPFNTLLPELRNSEVSIPAWKALLASFYGGIAEEVLLRLFVVSLFAWIFCKITGVKDGNPAAWGMWLSVVVAAIIFGLGHLPATSQLVALTGTVVLRAVVLNGIGGIIFGWLYWKKGLESAILAHFSADIVLHIIAPFAGSLFS